MELKLLKHQFKFVEQFFDNNLFWAIAIVSGFGAGKSYTLACAAVLSILKYPNVNVAVYSVTFDLIKLVNIVQICSLLDQFNVKYRLNKQDMILYVHGHGQIIFRSLTNPERIIGYGTSFSFVDELDTLPMQKAKDSWDKVIGRNRVPLTNGQRNKIGVFTTPEGYNFVYNRWKKNEEENRKKGYLLLHAKTTDNPYNEDNYVQNLIDSYPDNLIDAYINGEFVNLKGSQVYYSFDRDRNHEDFDFDALFEEDSNVVGFV